MADSDKAMAEVIEIVDEVTSPAQMTKREYKDFLEELIGSLEARLGAVREELRNEGEDDS